MLTTADVSHVDVDAIDAMNGGFGTIALGDSDIEDAIGMDELGQSVTANELPTEEPSAVPESIVVVDGDVSDVEKTNLVMPALI